MDEDGARLLYRWKAAHAFASDGNGIKQLVSKSIIRGSIPEEVLSGEICQCGSVLVGGVTVNVRIRPVNKKRKGKKGEGSEQLNECVATCLVCGRETVERI